MELGQTFQRKKVIRWLKIGFLVVYSIFVCAVSLQGKWEKVYSICGLTDQPTTTLPFSVRIFDVGSADCILIRNQTHAMLIDSATADKGVELAQTLQRMGISSLDYVVATHPHVDHIGGFPEILARIPAKKALISPLRSVKNYAVYRQLNAMFGSFQVPIHESVVGEVFPFGELCQIQVISAGVQGDDQNEASLVLRVVYGSVSMLFMGDAGEKSEESVLSSGTPLHSDLIKIGHHGSQTSSSLHFLQTVNPKYAVVSCGDVSPLSESTLLDLDQLGLRAYRTDLDGNLLFATDGTKCEMEYSG